MEKQAVSYQPSAISNLRRNLQQKVPPWLAES